MIDWIFNFLQKNLPENIDFLINFGGDMACRGIWKIALESPFVDGEAIGILEFSNSFLACSAGNKRKFGKSHHLINPHSGESAREISAVFLETSSTTKNAGMLTDSLATAFSVMSWDFALKKIKIITLLLALVVGFFAVSSWKNSLIGASVALYLLYAILFFPIFSRVFGIKIFGTLLKFREELGILIGVLSLVHLYQMLPYIEMFAKSKPILVIFGILPQIIILILTLTSNEFSRKKLGKNWKKLHRLVYIVPILIMIQIGLAKNWAI